MIQVTKCSRALTCISTYFSKNESVIVELFTSIFSLLSLVTAVMRVKGEKKRRRKERKKGEVIRERGKMKRKRDRRERRLGERIWTRTDPTQCSLRFLSSSSSFSLVVFLLMAAGAFSSSITHHTWLPSTARSVTTWEGGGEEGEEGEGGAR